MERYFWKTHLELYQMIQYFGRLCAGASPVDDIGSAPAATSGSPEGQIPSHQNDPPPTAHGHPWSRVGRSHGHRRATTMPAESTDGNGNDTATEDKRRKGRNAETEVALTSTGNCAKLLGAKNLTDPHNVPKPSLPPLAGARRGR